jgi:cytochrome c556
VKYPGNLIMILCLIALPSAVTGEEGGSRHPAAKQAPHHGADPLREEMMKLDKVFREAVSGVALGDGGRVHDALESMHGTMEHTHEGVRQGTVTLTKNSDRLQDFLNMDRQFHARLEDLAAAAHGNDQQAMVKLTQELLDRCVQCHRLFRNQ